MTSTMESLNLNILANSLPSSTLANAEADLMNNFKAAALSITTLYRSSRRTSKRAYNAGYAAACQDLLLMIQQGVSSGESSGTNGEGMSIGRIMDYVEARLEAIKSREEEEDEDEEKERGKQTSTKTPSSVPAGAVKPTHTVSSTAPPSKRQPPLAPPTPQSPSSSTEVRNHPAQHSSPSPPPTISLRYSSHAVSSSSAQRAAKSRLFAPSNVKDPALVASSATAPLMFEAPNTTVLSPVDSLSSRGIVLPTFPPDFATSMDITPGTKRRHNVMMLESGSLPTPMDSPASTGTDYVPTGSGTSRRRTRSSRGSAFGASHQHHIQDQNTARSGADAMDVEEEGRERKRVARR